MFFQSRKKRQALIFQFFNLFVCYFCLEKRVIDKFESIVEMASKLGTIQKFCEFIEDIHKITKCEKCDCPIEAYSSELRKVVFHPMVDYDVCRNFFIKLSFESLEVFWDMFNSHKKGKEHVKEIVDSSEAWNKQIKEKYGNVILEELIAIKQQIEKQIEYLTHKICLKE